MVKNMKIWGITTACLRNWENNKKLTNSYSRNTVPRSLEVDRKLGVWRVGEVPGARRRCSQECWQEIKFCLWNRDDPQTVSWTCEQITKRILCRVQTCSLCFKMEHRYWYIFYHFKFHSRNPRIELETYKTPENQTRKEVHSEIYRAIIFTWVRSQCDVRPNVRDKETYSSLRHILIRHHNH
jgi:hypothetical protein